MDIKNYYDKIVNNIKEEDLNKFEKIIREEIFHDYKNENIKIELDIIFNDKYYNTCRITDCNNNSIIEGFCKKHANPDDVTETRLHRNENEITYYEEKENYFLTTIHIPFTVTIKKGNDFKNIEIYSPRIIMKVKIDKKTEEITKNVKDIVLDDYYKKINKKEKILNKIN